MRDPRTLIPRLSRELPLLACLLLWSLYLRSAGPDIGLGDAGELLSASSLLTGAHPPGYPLWVILSRAVRLVPVGCDAFRSTLSSQLCTLLALWLLASVAGRILGRKDSLVPAFVALLLGCSNRLWQGAISTEVYALHLALFAGAFALAFARQTSRRALIPLCMGLGFSNHYSFVAALPLLLLSFERKGMKGTVRKARPGLWLSLLILGLSPYLLLPLRGGQSHLPGWSNNDHFRGALETLARWPYQEIDKPRDLRLAALEGQSFLMGLCRDLSLPLTLLAGAGALILLKRPSLRSWVPLACFAVAGPGLTLWANAGLDERAMGILDPFYAPCEWVLGLFACVALAGLAARWKRCVTGLLLAGALIHCSTGCLANWERSAVWGEGIIQYLSRSLPRRSGLLAASDQLSFLSNYMLMVEQRGSARATMTQRVPYWGRLLATRLDPLPLPSVQEWSSWCASLDRKPTAAECSEWAQSMTLSNSQDIPLFWEPQAHCAKLWPLLEPAGLLLSQPGHRSLLGQDFRDWVKRSGDPFPRGEAAGFLSGVYSNLGVVQFRRGRPDEALSSWRTATWFSPLSPAAWGNIGVLQMTARKLDEAQVSFLHAVRLDPFYYDAMVNLSVLARAQGQVEESRRWAQRAFDSCPWRSEAASLLK